MLGRWMISISAASFALATLAFAEEPPKGVDPKMPPMPSMETPDASDMTKPEGSAKSAAAVKPAPPPKASKAPPPAKAGKSAAARKTAKPTSRKAGGAKKAAGKRPTATRAKAKPARGRSRRR